MISSAAPRQKIVHSFFPTIQEFSIGLKWIREHPVASTAAAAAVAAVSVLTYLRKNEPEIVDHFNWQPGSEGNLSEKDSLDSSSGSSDSLGSKSSCAIIPGLNSIKSSSSLETNQLGTNAYNEIPIAPDDTISPQWGWYVAITPPQEQYIRHPFPSTLQRRNY